MGKKKQLPYRFDLKTMQIIFNREFEKRLSDTTSPEFKKFCELHETFPEFKIARKNVNITKKKESYKGLTYEYMERYIAIKGNSTDRREYDDMRLLAKCHSKRFPVIKQWFLRKYPEVKKYGAKEEFVNQPTAA